MKRVTENISWFARLNANNSPNLKQYLRGLRGYTQLASTVQRPYNFYLLFGGTVLSWAFIKFYGAHLLTRLEPQWRKKPNALVPIAVYDIRKKHYVFWEISRVSRGLPKTFTYSKWDQQAKMMFHVGMDGQMVFEKLNLLEESIDLLENPLLGPLFRRKGLLVQDDLMTKQANVLAIYYLNLHKRYDLNNYLQYKAITPMDWIRTVYQLFMVKTGLADKYRNEHFLPKPDMIYEWERKAIHLNAGGPDNSVLAHNILVCLNHDLQAVSAFLKKYRTDLE